MMNCTGDRNSPMFTKTLDQASTLQAGIVVFYSVLNIFLSITASLGNSSILIALHKVSSLYPPTKLLFRCLAVTDLCVCLISQPLFATPVLNVVLKMNLNVFCNIRRVIFASRFILGQISIFTSTSISVERLFLLMGLRYRRALEL